MPWFNIWDGLKSKICRYFLRRYLGQFLDDELNLEQLKLELCGGKATLCDVALKVEALNELLEGQGWPFEFVSAHIGHLIVTVPWNALLTNDSSIEIGQITLRLRPVHRTFYGLSMLESMWSSASSSLQLAQECMRQADEVDGNDALPGNFICLDKFTETIDNVLNRITVQISNLKILLEYPLNNESHHVNMVLLEISVDSLQYRNKSGIGRVRAMTDSSSEDEATTTTTTSSLNALPAFITHNVSMKGVQICLEEQRKKEPLLNDSMFDLKQLILQMNEEQNMEIIVKQCEEINGPKINLNIQFSELRYFLAPRQINLMLHCFKRYTMTGGGGGDTSRNPPDSIRGRQYQEFHQGGGGFIISSNTCQESFRQMEKSNYSEFYCDAETDQFVSSFNVKIKAILGILLIEDINSNSSSSKSNHLMHSMNSHETTSSWSQENWEYFREISRIFYGTEYKSTSTTMTMTMTKNDWDYGFCKESYLFLNLTPISVIGHQLRNDTEIRLQLSTIISKVDFLEVIGGEAIPILKFKSKEMVSMNDSITDLEFLYSSINNEYQRYSTESELTIKLGNCILELDITLFDRIGALLQQIQFFLNNCCSETGEGERERERDRELDSRGGMKLMIQCKSLDIKFRFPIINYGLNSETNDSWRQRNIRSDYFLLKLQTFQLNVLSSTINIQMSGFIIFYMDDDNDCKKSFKLLTIKTSKEILNETQRIWILIKLSNDCKGVSQLRTEDLNEMKPFSSRQNCQQRNTAGFIKTDYVDTEATVFPGEKHEIEKFCSTAISASSIQITLNFPEMELCLRSKKLYEIIYNRLNADILLWTPRSPYLLQMHPKSHLDMDNNTKYNSNHHKNIDKSVIRNKCSISLQTIHTNIILCTPKDMENWSEPTMSEKCGKFIIQTKNLELFIVNGYNGDENLAYVCIQVSNFEINHSDDISKNDGWHRVLYEVPENLTKGPISNNEQRDMLSVAMEIRKENKQKIKRIKVSNGIKRAALYCCDQSTLTHVWLTELIDFLDIVEYPVDGIEFYGTIIEMQMHFWDCAVDFRPKDFEFRAVMEIIYFCMTSNIISEISGANMRFILEECVISIGPQMYPENSDDRDHLKPPPSDDSKELVPVIEIGLFDISLRLNKDSLLLNTPKLDFRCILNNVHMRTCYDSASALARLITHLANDTQQQQQQHMDNIEKNMEKTTILEATTIKDNRDREPPLNGGEETTLNDNRMELENNVNDLLAEAVQETITTINDDFGQKLESINPNDQNNAVDFEALDVIGDFESSFTSSCQAFNGIEERREKGEEKKKNNSVPTYHHIFDSCEDVSQELHFKSDDEYCIVDEKTLNYENIQLLNEPIQIVDNHFCVPTQSADPLRSPENFPASEQRYVLCEMTFTWHLYGGQDFGKVITSKCCNKKIYSEMSATYRQGFARIERNRGGGGDTHQSSYSKKKEKTTWKSEGGHNRDHEVLVEIQLNKLRFSYDIFPTESIYTSRKVLLVNEIEIKDRLQCSDINKLLYSPTIKNLSNKRAHHMLIMKALNVKSNPTNNNSQDSQEECSLRISLAPIRLHIDQATLEFLLNYFLDLKKEYESHEFELMMTNLTSFNDEKMTDDDDDGENLEPPMEHENTSEITENINKNSTTNCTYFRELIFSPAVTICFDYHGRRVVLSKGPIAGLLMGLGQLQCSQIVLKKISHKRGILGIEKLMQFLCKEWLHDIKRHQLSKILSGVGPTYAFVQLFQGIHDLFWLPVEYYQKDGTVIRGLRIAAQSFSTRTIFAIIELTSRLIELLQFTAETTFDIVATDTSMARRRKGQNRSKCRLRRPKDIREGVVNAYELMKEGFNDSASNLIDMAKIQHDQHGMTGAVGAVLRQVPQLVVSPAVLATQATTNILGGVRNSLLPKSKIEEIEKWKEDNC